MAGLHTIKWTVKNPFRLNVIWTHSDNGFTEQLVFAGHSHGYMLKSRWSDQLASTLIPLTTPADHSRICTQQRQQVQYVWNGPGGIKTNPKKKPSIKRDSDNQHTETQVDVSSEQRSWNWDLLKQILARLEIMWIIKQPWLPILVQTNKWELLTAAAKSSNRKTVLLFHWLKTIWGGVLNAAVFWTTVSWQLYRKHVRIEFNI